MIPAWLLGPFVKYCLITAAVVTLVSGFYWWADGNGAARVQARWTVDKLAQQQALTDALTKARATEQVHSQQVQEIAHAYATQLAANDAAANVLHAQLERLRNAIRTAGDGAMPKVDTTTGKPNDAAEGLGGLLSECAGELVQMAIDADRLNDQVIGLQAYTRSVDHE